MTLNGATRDDFMLKSLDAWVRLPGEGESDWAFVGKTTKEKTFAPEWEMVEWRDGVPATIYVMDVSQVDYSMAFGFMQLADPDLLGIMLNAVVVKGYPNYNYVYMGSDPGVLPEYEWSFIGRTRDRRYFELRIRLGVVRDPQEIAFGSGEYAVGNIKVQALPDEGVTDVRRDMCYFKIEKGAAS